MASRVAQKWFDWKARHDIATVQGKSQFACRDFRFFPDEHTADESVRIAAEEDTNGADDTTIDSFVILESNVQKLSHNGFVYAILVANVDASSPIFGNERAPVLISGAGRSHARKNTTRTYLYFSTPKATVPSNCGISLDGHLYTCIPSAPVMEVFLRFTCKTVCSTLVHRVAKLRWVLQ